MSPPFSEPSVRSKGAAISLVGFGVLGGLALLMGLDTESPWLPFLLSIFFFGLPHGAADWLLLRPSSRKVGLRNFVLYSLVGLSIGFIAWIEPRPLVFLFFLLSMLHFGNADGRDHESFGLRGPGQTVRLGGIARMAVFFSLLSWLHAGEVAQLFQRVEKIIGSPGSADGLVESVGLVSFVILVIALIVWTTCVLARVMQSGAGRPAKSRFFPLMFEILEGVLLISAAIYLHPVFSVGLYFLSWHAFRHSMLVSQRIFGPSEDFFPAKALLVMHLRSWPFFVPVIPVMAILLMLNGSLLDPDDWVASLLIICIVFTLPHHLIVERWLAAGETKKLPTAKTEFPGERRRAAVPVKG